MKPYAVVALAMGVGGLLSAWRGATPRLPRSGRDPRTRATAAVAARHAPLGNIAAIHLESQTITIKLLLKS
jgi:hypothetical protein